MAEQEKQHSQRLALKRLLWRTMQLLVVLSLVGGIVYWIKFSPIPVSEHSVVLGTIAAEVMGTGTLEARVAATIGPKISGRIKSVQVDQGDRVSAGDLLVELDDEELSQQVAIAKANLEATRAAITRLVADKDRATATYTQVQKSHARNQSLAAQNAVSQDELDRSTEALAVAITDVSRSEAAITEGQKTLVAAEKTFEYQQTRLEDSHIHAPFDGMIVNRGRELGDVVVPGSAILKLISTDQLWISAWVDETEMARLQPEQLARIVFRSEPKRSFKGQVVRLGKETDRETREFIVDVDALQLPANWAVGQRAEAYIEVARKDDVVLLPANLILSRDGASGVFVSADGISTWRPLTIGLRNRDMVEVMAGLNSGDVVVTPTNLATSLSDGRKVIAP